MSRNDQKCPEMTRNVQKCPEMSRNVQKCPEFYKKNIDPIVFSCCCSTAREMTGQCENNTSNQMLPETNIDKSPYTYVKKTSKRILFH